MNELERLEDDLWSDEPQEITNEVEEIEDSYYNENGELENLEEPTNVPEEENYVHHFLRSRGIDPNKVRIADEQGIIDEIPFSELSDAEKLAILDTDKYDLSDEEINTLNYLRQNNINLQEYSEYVKNQAIAEYLQQTESVTDFDQYTDEAIYKKDLLRQYPDITDEELDSEWEHAQMNPSLLEKKITGLRETLKQQELMRRQYAEEQDKKVKEDKYNTFANGMAYAAKNIDTIMNVELDDEQRNEILRLCLERDVNGQSQFNKFFTDPEAVFKMAWFMKYGEQAMTAVNDYWKNYIGQTRKTQAKTVNKTKTRTKTADPYGLDEVFG